MIYGYIRISTDKQSTENQKFEILKYAQTNSLIKGNYNLGNDIPSKVLVFAFGLGAEIERNLISQRTKDALAKKKSEGKILGRPKGSLSKETKLTGKEDIIKELLSKKIYISRIARILGVNRITLTN